MKTFKQILEQAERGDYPKVAKLAGCGARNVEYVVKEQRADNFNIQKIFSDYLANKHEMARKYKKNRRRSALQVL